MSGVYNPEIQPAFVHTAAGIALASKPIPAPSIPKPRGSATAAISYFIQHGWTRAQAEGIAANLQGESQFDPDLKNPGSSAYGVAQWLDLNQKRLLAHFGKSVHSMSFDEQLDALQWDLTEGQQYRAGNALRNAVTPEQAADIFLRRYGRPLPSDADALSTQRQGIARGYERLQLTVPDIGVR